VQAAKDILLADPSPGERFILLVTDGDPDFCNNPGINCPADALIASLQLAAAAGVQTLVFGINNPAITAANLFDYYAQAGVGQTPNFDLGLQVREYDGTLNSQCSQFPYWQTLRTMNGNSAELFQPAGRYSAEGGTATAFLDSDPTALATQIRSAVEGLKSCIFNLAQSNVEVKAGSESEGNIFVDDQLIPLDQWRMNDAVTLELLGAACETWQRPEVTKFFAGFPCDAIVVR
jgi:hypothetical protein